MSKTIDELLGKIKRGKFEYEEGKALARDLSGKLLSTGSGIDILAEWLNANAEEVVTIRKALSNLKRGKISDKDRVALGIKEDEEYFDYHALILRHSLEIKTIREIEKLLNRMPNAYDFTALVDLRDNLRQAPLIDYDYYRGMHDLVDYILFYGVIRASGMIERAMYEETKRANCFLSGS